MRSFVLVCLGALIGVSTPLSFIICVIKGPQIAFSPRVAGLRARKKLKRCPLRLIKSL